MTEQRGEYENGEVASLEHLAQRLEDNPQFMASVLERHRRQEGKSREAQQEMLGVDRTGYARLALCHRPAADPMTFHAQSEKIARYTGADVAALVQIVRRVDAVESMDPRTLSPDTRTTTASVGTSEPIVIRQRIRPMAAARDRLSEGMYSYSTMPVDSSSGQSEDTTPFAPENTAESEQPSTGGSESDQDAHGPAPESPSEISEDKPDTVA